MADTNDPHFNKIFWFIVGTSVFVFIYISAITFFDIPKENQRFADTILGFLLGSVFGGGASYLWGGTPPAIKKPTVPGNTTAEISATISSDTKDDVKL